VPAALSLRLVVAIGRNGARVALSAVAHGRVQQIDLAGTKASVLQVRAEAKDYIDMDALMTMGKITLPTALAAAQKLYGSSFNPEVTLKALSYFGDGNLHTLADDVKRRLVVAAREVDLEHLPDIDRATRGSDLDHGL